MNIRVKRYQNPNAYESSIEPEDGNWVLFVPSNGGCPDLWVRTIAVDDNGARVEGYIQKSSLDAALLNAADGISD